MKSIWNEIEEIKNGKQIKKTMFYVSYRILQLWLRQMNGIIPMIAESCFPFSWVASKISSRPTVGSIDDGFGDRNLVCTCNSLDIYRQDALKQ